MRKLIDLHIHTNFSDGVLSPKEVIEEAYHLNLPPTYKSKRLKIYFVNQSGTKPPKFTFHVNNKGLIHFSYERYLENKIRENFDFEGTPIVLQFKNRGEE